MSYSNLTPDGELRYIVQWFNEWSEYQREDFLPILAEYLANGAYVNGIVQGLAAGNLCADKPMSLFQCRVKLFREWSPKWPETHKEKLKEKCTEIDGEFAERLDKELLGEPVVTNGSGAAAAVVVDDDEEGLIIPVESSGISINGIEVLTA